MKHSSSVVRCQEKLFFYKIKYEDIEYVYIILKHKCKLEKKTKIFESSRRIELKHGADWEGTHILGDKYAVLFVLLNYIWVYPDTNQFLLNKGNEMVVRRQ